MKGVFNKTYGSELLKSPLALLGIMVLMLGIGYLVAIKGVIIGVALLGIPWILLYMYGIFSEPKVGLIGLYLFNYFVLGLTRYITDVPFGLGVDTHFILIYLALFFKSFFEKVPWGNAKNDLVLIAFIWFGYALFEFVNPEAASKAAWFYSMRGVALYMLFTIPLIFIIFNKQRDLSVFLKIWAFLSLIATLKGLMQMIIGPDPWEQAWLDGNTTHVLFGRIRIFSFMSDAGQFGAAQGHSGVVFGILAINEKKSKKWKYFYLLVSIMAFVGMMISGTRGAIAVPIMGFATYVVLTKNTKVIITGLLVLLSVFIFFKFTYIGQSNYSIRRMRTAFDMNDASLQVRLENQNSLKSYLASRPFGGGLGSSGNWGKRFSPNTFLADTPTDSWYVMIWAEQGIVGLTLHLLILFYIVIKGSYLIAFRLKNPWVKAQLSALVAGMMGIMAASYGNGVFGQMPTGLIIYSSMAFIFLGKKYEEELDEKDKMVKT